MLCSHVGLRDMGAWWQVQHGDHRVERQLHWNGSCSPPGFGRTQSLRDLRWHRLHSPRHARWGPQKQSRPTLHAPKVSTVFASRQSNVQAILQKFFFQRISVKRGGFCSADGDWLPSFRCWEAGRHREDHGCGDEQTQPRIRMHSIPQGRLQNTQRRFVKVRSNQCIPWSPTNNAKVFFCVIDFTMSRGSFVSLKTSSVSGRFFTAFLSSMDAFPARRRKSESFPRLWIGASYGRTECLLFQSYTPSPKIRTKDQGKLSIIDFHKLFWMEYYTSVVCTSSSLNNNGGGNYRVSGRVPLLWAQSLYVVGNLLSEGHLAIGELDPVNRRLSSLQKPETIVQVQIFSYQQSCMGNSCKLR